MAKGLGCSSRPPLVEWVDELVLGERRKQSNSRFKRYTDAERVEIVAGAYVGGSRIADATREADIDKEIEELKAQFKYYKMEAAVWKGAVELVKMI